MSWELHPGLLHRQQGPKYLKHLPLPSQAQQQEEELEMEQPAFELAPRYWILPLQVFV